MAVAQNPAELSITWGRFHHMLAKRLASIISQQAGLLCRAQGTEQGVYRSSQLMDLLPPLAVATQRQVMPGVSGSQPRLPALFCFQSELAQVLVDRLLGGRGRWPGGARLLTALEAKVMRPLLFRLWEAVGELWPGSKAVFEPVSISDRSSAPPISPPAELLSARELLARHDASRLWWVAYFSVQLPPGQGMAYLCLPLELLDQQMESGPGVTVGRSEDEDRDQIHAWNTRSMGPAGDSEGPNQPTEISVVLGRARLYAHDLLGLECGDIIKLEQPVDGEVTVFVNGSPVWLAQPGTVRGRLAVRLLRKHGAEKEVVSA